MLFRSVVTHQAALMEGIANEFVQMTAGQIVAREPTVRKVNIRVEMPS